MKSKTCSLCIKWVVIVCLLTSGIVFGQTNEMASVGDLEGIWTKYDEFENITWTHTNYLCFRSGMSYSLFVRLTQGKRADSRWYWLWVKYEGSEYFGIHWDESLVLLADGQRMPFTANYGAHETDLGGIEEDVTEYMPYKITPAQIRKLAYSDEVKLRVYGSDGYYEGLLGKKKLENFQLFYEAVVHGKWRETLRKQDSIKAVKDSLRAAKDSLEEYVRGTIRNFEECSSARIKNAKKLCEKYDWDSFLSALEGLERKYKQRKEDSLLVDRISQAQDVEKVTTDTLM